MQILLPFDFCVQTEDDDDEDKLTLEEEIEEERQALIKAGMESCET